MTAPACTHERSWADHDEAISASRGRVWPCESCGRWLPWPDDRRRAEMEWRP